MLVDNATFSSPGEQVPYDAALEDADEELFDEELLDELFDEESELFDEALAESLLAVLEPEESDALTEADDDDRESVL